VAAGEEGQEEASAPEAEVVAAAAPSAVEAENGEEEVE
jgi:hypothetical protein